MAGLVARGGLWCGAGLTARMATPAPAVALLRERMAAAPSEVRAALEIDAAGEFFTIPGAIFSATK